MQSQPQPPLRADSPSDNNHTISNLNTNVLHHTQDPLLFSMHSTYTNSTNHIHSDYPTSEHDTQHQQQQHSAKLNGFGVPSAYNRSSATFSTFPNSTVRPRHNTYQSPPSTASATSPPIFYPTSSDIFPPQSQAPPPLSLPPHMTSPTQSHQSNHQGSFDLYNTINGNVNGNGNGGSNAKQQQQSYIVDYNNPSAVLQSHKAQLNGYPTSAAPNSNPYLSGGALGTGLHISSQTPYGPHLQLGQGGTAGANGITMNGVGMNGLAMGGGGMTASASQNMNANANGASGQEEISTIFVVGFPEDMQEREFQNMFTFSTGFEAATLKIPNKEYTAYGGIGGNTMGLALGSSSTIGGIGMGRGGLGLNSGYSGQNDPYNLVTVNQGGVVVDGGRDGTMASWPSVQDDGVNGGHFAAGAGMLGGVGGMNNNNMPPRKQIIGFAKFRTRGEALEARDVLQGRRVDIEKGAVLKAEMAKKNLHTKRGVGPINGVGGQMGGGQLGAGAGMGAMGMGGGGMTGMGMGMGPAEGLGMMNGMALSMAETVPLSSRERELNTLGAMGLGRMSGWRDGDREEDDRRRGERDMGVITAMGLGTRGPRERAEEDERERERRRKEKEAKLRAGNSTAFDAFHSVPIQISRQSSSHANGMLVSPPLNHSMLGVDVGINGGGTSPMLGNVYHSHQQPQDDVIGPWDGIRKASIAGPPPSSHRSPSPVNNNHAGFSRPYSPTLESAQQQHQYGLDLHYHHAGHIQSDSSASSVADGSQSSSIGLSGNDLDQDDDLESRLSRGMAGLAVSTDYGPGNTSPQLPSPASGASSGSTRNAIDQNPPINTLYVGNLPTSPPPSGYPQDHLEDSLRELFQTRPGFRRLCYRQKNNGPMCFVEFEDVNHATKTLNDLYGHTLNGLIKGGGIRLSYSKNPLGVRTPTSAGSSGPSLQQQQLQSNGGQPGGSSPFPPDAFQSRQQQQHDHDQGLRDTSLMTSPPPQSLPLTSPYNNYMMSSPPPRFLSPVQSPSAFGNSSLMPLTSSSNAFLPRSANNMNSIHSGYALSPGGGSSSMSTFSPFDLSSPSHSTIPDHVDQQQLHEQQQYHYSTRVLSPPANNIEAARAI